MMSPKQHIKTLVASGACIFFAGHRKVDRVGNLYEKLILLTPTTYFNAIHTRNYRPRSEGDNALGSVRPSVCPSVRPSGCTQGTFVCVSVRKIAKGQKKKWRLGWSPVRSLVRSLVRGCGRSAF